MVCKPMEASGLTWLVFSSLKLFPGTNEIEQGYWVGLCYTFFYRDMSRKRLIQTQSKPRVLKPYKSTISTLILLIWGSLEEVTYKCNQGREDHPSPLSISSDQKQYKQNKERKKPWYKNNLKQRSTIWPNWKFKIYWLNLHSKWWEFTHHSKAPVPFQMGLN